MVDMRPSTIVKLSLTTLASGARQLVVHEALLLVYVCEASIDKCSVHGNDAGTNRKCHTIEMQT